MSDKEHTHIFDEYDKVIDQKINRVENHLARRVLRHSWMNARKHIQEIRGYADSASSDIFNSFSHNVEIQEEKWRISNK